MRSSTTEFVRIAGLAALCLLMASGSMGAVRSHKAAAKQSVKPRPEMSTICIEASTGTIISESNADVQRAPASMVKMMEFLLVAEGLKEGKWTLETPITVTKHAEHMGGTQVYLQEGEVFTVDRLMQAVAVHSANDAAMAIAEGLWGSEEAYKKRMNERAKEIGMNSSEFHSVHGLPPAKGQEPDRTTARDMARLGQFCVLDPQILKWTSQKEIQWKPDKAVQRCTNELLIKMEGCDGIKTGFINDAGWCITATVVRDGVRLIAVVMGSNCKRDRFAEAKEVLEDGFSQICRKKLIAKGDAVGEFVTVANCETQQVKLKASDDLWVFTRKSDADKIALTPKAPAKIEPPIQAGTELGEVEADLNGQKLGAVSLIAPLDLAKASWRWKLRNSIMPR